MFQQAIAASHHGRRVRWSLGDPRVALALIVAVAVATRIVSWWNPVAHPDDPFYLLVGREMLAGHFPYVEVWDRKPFGLFLLYAAFAWIGGGSMVAVNVVATAFAAATAWIIREIGFRFASATGATLAALAYLFVIPLIGGQNGQSPVFYNLLMAGAAWLLIDSANRSSSIVRPALGAMLLCGLAITIKQISFVEGGYFGLAFLWLMHHRGMSLVHLVAIGVIMMAVAVLPTALMLAGYALAGAEQLDKFLFATVTSIFLKSGWGARSVLAGVLFVLVHLAPLLFMGFAGAVMRRRTGHSVRDGLLLGWIVAALLGYIAVPHFSEHYALPFVVPLAVSAATFFDRGTGLMFFLALAAFCVIVAPPIRDLPSNRQSRVEFDQLASAVDTARQGGCIHVGDGPTRLYSTTGACSVTRYLFPDHLSLAVEADAVGVDTELELKAILARRPAVIVTRDRNRQRYSAAYQEFLRQVRRHYRNSYMTSPNAPLPLQGIRVWKRKDLAAPTT